MPQLTREVWVKQYTTLDNEVKYKIVKLKNTSDYEIGQVWSKSVLKDIIRIGALVVNIS